MTDAGQSWSTPTVARMDVGGVTQNADKAVVVVGGGYDPVHDTHAHPATPDGQGAGVHILDLMSGATLWRGGPDAAASSEGKQFTRMTRSMPNQIRVVDVNVDGLADRMYASDMGGQLWRFDVINGQPASTLVNGGVIAQLGAEGLSTPTAADTRRFYNAPDLSLFNDVKQGRRFIAISIGSGYRAHPLDTSSADKFYSVRDDKVFNILTQTEYDNYAIVTEADLVEVSGQKNAVITSNDSGWKFTLPANQMVLADSITFDDSVFFVAFSPDSDAATSCTAGRGTNFLYRVNVVNGDPVVNNLDTLAPSDADDARRQTLAQGGIAPTPTILFPAPDDPNCTGQACAPPPLACVGVECRPPGFNNFPVRTLWTQDGIE
jgi:type IV pilus assembly protein PilY1